MINLNRVINLGKIPASQSYFLFGARGTGKSTELHKRYPNSIYYDLLKGDDFARLLANPWLLRERLIHENPQKLLQPIIIDEIQKIPQLLDEVHWLIENKGLSFVLCGSSARKLKRGGANLLAGRAWDLKFFPLVYKEIPKFDLLRAFNHGLLPTSYISETPNHYLQSYVNLYLKEEIQEEGLVRNLPGFARFLEVAAFSNSEILNYNNIARDCGIDAKTVKNYYQILADTLVGYFVEPFVFKRKRDLITASPKFYLFDVGIANFLAGKKLQNLKGFDAGISFEHFILTELTAYIGMHGIYERIEYWRTKTGLEVDFVLNRSKLAIEVKLTDNPSLKDLHGLIAFCKDYQPEHAIVVCFSPFKRILETDNIKIEVLPWQEFLTNLWNGNYIKQ